MEVAVFAATGLMFFTFFVVWLQTRLQYRIGRDHLKISVLGITLRRVALSDIKRISKRHPGGFAEYWYSTTRPKHRTLALQLNSGLRKTIMITPRNRYIFMTDLQNAIKRAQPNSTVEVEAIQEGATE
jgi:hypothetical protein